MREAERQSGEIESLKGYKTLANRLQGKLDALEDSIDERITKAAQEAVAKAVAPLMVENAELRAKVEKQHNEILRLKTQIDKNSSNSSKPPSSNGFVKVPNNRETSGKKQGGQKGHKGNRLNIPDNLDELVSEGRAEHIIINEVSDGSRYTSDWEIDIKIIPVFTERRRKIGAPQNISYGNGIAALCVYLSVIGLVPYERLSEFLSEVTFGTVRISKATIAKFNHAVAEKADLTPIVQDLLNGQVIHTDETPAKTTERPCTAGGLETSCNTTFNAYIRTYSNKTSTLLTAAPRKTGESVVADNILTMFHGIVSQDHEAKFYNFGDEHATCGAHLSRELKGLENLWLLEWAGEVREFFREMNNQKNEDVRNGKTACEPVSLRQYEQRYDKLIEKGKSTLASMNEKTFGYDEQRKMVARLNSYKDSYLLFIRNYDAPFTNNQAERDLRHCKTKQKVSGCYRSWQGIQDYCKIRSLLGTAKKRCENLMDVLCRTLKPLRPAGQ